MVMAYSTYTFAQVRQEVANALNDAGKVFTTDAELKVHVWNSLRFWNVLTGDNKQWYQLAISPTNPSGIWYDLQQTSGSPRQVYLSDVILYSWIQYALIEQQLANAALSTSQFSTDQMVQSLQRARDEFIFRTACTSTVYSPAVTPNVETVSLRSSVIAVRRAYWMPTKVGTPPAYPTGANPFPLWRSDEYAVNGYLKFSVVAPGNPLMYSPGIEPPLTLAMTPPPGWPGSLELLTVESQSALSNPPPPATIFSMPSDFVPALYWRTLADMLSMNAECQDLERAAYCRERFEQFCELLKAYPFVLSARVAGLPIYADAVETLDSYMPSWEVATPATNPPILAYSGQNLIAFPSPSAMNIQLYMVANANLPSADLDYIQLGQEVMDAIVGYAQHTATFKQGWAEFSQTMPLFKAIVQLAAKRNAHVRAMSSFRELLYDRATREDDIVSYDELSEREIEAQ